MYNWLAAARLAELL